MKKAVGTLLVAWVMLFVGHANAQEESMAPATAPEVSVEVAPEKGSLQEKWGEKRRIKTLQRRLFAKDGRAEFSAYMGIVPNDPFVFYLPVGLRFDYHFNEAFALELSGSFLGCFTGDVGEGQERGFSEGCLRIASDLKNELSVEKADRTQISQIKLLDQQVTRVDVTAMWSPIFGKVAVMNDSLVHFDVNFVGGAGALVTESINNIDVSKVDYNFGFEGVIGAGIKFYFGERYGLRADFRQFIYQKQEGGTANPSEASIGFSVFTD